VDEFATAMRCSYPLLDASRMPAANGHFVVRKGLSFCFGLLGGKYVASPRIGGFAIDFPDAFATSATPVVRSTDSSGGRKIHFNRSHCSEKFREPEKVVHRLGAKLMATTN
jgi:hypothetical protein